jgi:hypothetical protein
MFHFYHIFIIIIYTTLNNKIIFRSLKKIKSMLNLSLSFKHFLEYLRTSIIYLFYMEHYLDCLSIREGMFILPLFQDMKMELLPLMYL